MIRLLPALLLLSSCAWWAPTHQAGVRRVAAHAFAECMKNPQTQTWASARRACIDESASYCRSQGLESSCGFDEWYLDGWTRRFY